MLLDLSRRVEALLQIELTPNFSNVGKSFPTELSLITEEKRLIKVAVLNLQRNDLEDKGNFFVFLFPCWEGRDLQIGV